MKKVLLATAAVFATSLAVASGPGGHGSPGSSSPEIIINGSSIQTTSAVWSSVTNASEDDAYALQNLASNVGNVKITGASEQHVALTKSGVSNYADRDAYATQSLASNLGKVTIAGSSLQVVAAKHSYLGNYATDKSKAVQNISSNNACEQCVPAGK